MCDSTPIGELCETRVAMMKSDTETFTNGHGENQEVANETILLLLLPFRMAMLFLGETGNASDYSNICSFCC